MPDGVERPGSLQTLKLGANGLRIHDVRIVAPHPPADKHRALFPMCKADVTNESAHSATLLSCRRVNVPGLLTHSCIVTHRAGTLVLAASNLSDLA